MEFAFLLTTAFELKKNSEVKPRKIKIEREQILGLFLEKNLKKKSTSPLYEYSLCSFLLNSQSEQEHKYHTANQEQKNVISSHQTTDFNSCKKIFGKFFLTNRS